MIGKKITRVCARLLYLLSNIFITERCCPTSAWMQLQLLVIDVGRSNDLDVDVDVGG